MNVAPQHAAARAGLTIVPIVPWHGAPRRQGAPDLTDIFAQMSD